MNDENSVFENAETTPLSVCDTLETEIASERITCNNESEKTDCKRADQNSADIFADTAANSNFDCENPDSQTQESELEQLRSELKQLREELALRDSRMRQEESITRGYEEFCNLYPDVPVSSLSQEIWRDVEKGTSLAAAYALAEKKKAVALQKATESNTHNRTRSAGAVFYVRTLIPQLFRLIPLYC